MMGIQFMMNSQRDGIFTDDTENYVHDCSHIQTPCLG